jgi:uncharacterized protein (TIGR02599 family)
LEHGSNPPLSDALSNPLLFRRAERYLEDMETVTALLTAQKLNFRVFTATVPIRSSKWGSGSGT